MDRPAQGHPQNVEFLGLTLTPADLEVVRCIAIKHYVDHGNPSMPRSIVQALADFLQNKNVRLTNNKQET